MINVLLKKILVSSNEYILNVSTRYVNSSNNETIGEEVMASLDIRALPELYDKRENCCGCSACEAVCPLSAILMLPDEEGFLYPVINLNKCVRCYKCMDVCDFKIKE
jgi:formate hydrogenlyase subunit 6/NADH:ubiquinone oxidoreductase subunit I